jgi:DNA repair exonuclease SbcCD ATPase subunit
MAIANLIARLGLDSKEFLAAIEKTKAAVGGFRTTMSNTSTSMRNLFDVVLKPIAVVTAAVMALRKVLSGLNEIMSMTSNNMQAIRVGNTEAGVKTLADEVERAREAFQQLNEDQDAVVASEEKRIKAAEDLADAESKLKRAIDLRNDAESGGQGAEEINRLYDMADAARKAENNIERLEKQQDAKRKEAADKSTRSMEAKEQAKDAEEAHAKASKQAIAASKRAAGLYNQGTAKKLASFVYGTITQEDPWKEQAEYERDEANRANAAAEKFLAQKKSLADEAKRLERESLQATADIGNLEKQIESEKNAYRARQLEERAKIEAQGFADRNAAEQRAAERIGAISGRGLDVGSMARVGGFLGGERPGLAVADKQLQISKEMLDLAKATRIEQTKQTELLARLTGTPMTGP